MKSSKWGTWHRAASALALLFVAVHLAVPTGTGRHTLASIQQEGEGGSEGGGTFGGDVTGDGEDDTITGDPEAGSQDKGKVEILDGESGELIVTIKGLVPEGKFGYSVWAASDLNGDTENDLVVGAPFEGQGRVYVFYGPFDSEIEIQLDPEDAEFALDCPDEDAWVFGHLVMALGDANADGIPDVFVRAIGPDEELVDQRRAYAFSGVDGSFLISTANLAPPPCAADITGPFGYPDGQVGIDDLTAVVLSWGPCPASCAADVAPVGEPDGLVNIDEYTLIILGWGQCPGYEVGVTYTTNGIGGGNWTDPTTWTPPGVPGWIRPYDSVRILPGDSVLQEASIPHTLGLYLLEDQGSHVFDNNATLSALVIQANGNWTTVQPSPLGWPSITIHNNVLLWRPNKVLIDNTYDCATFCEIVNNAPPPFDDLGPCTADPCAGGPAESQFENPTTHRALTDVAMDNNLCTVDAYLRNELLLPAGIDSPATSIGGTTRTLKEWAIEGAHDEDVPDSRVLNHFLEPITNEGLELIFQYPPANQWARGHGDNLYNLSRARDYFVDMLTAPSPEQRSEAARLTFASVGHILHLLQDMAQPAHTRSDRHPFDRPLEDYAGAHYGNTPELNALTGVQTIPAASAPPRFALTLSLPGHDTFDGFFDTDQWTGQGSFVAFQSAPGMAEYSHFNFFSEDTIFSSYPRPSLALDQATIATPAGVEISIHASNDPISNPDVFVAKTTPVGLGVETGYILCAGVDQGINQYANAKYGRTIQNYSLSIQNAFVLEGYCQRLLPTSIAYCTDMLNWLFRATISVEVVDAVIDGKQLRITNTFAETMSGGTWRLYHIDTTTQISSLVSEMLGYPGTLAPGQSFTHYLPPESPAGRYVVVYRGSTANESSTVVAMRPFDICPCAQQWSSSGTVGVTPTGIAPCDVRVNVGDDRSGDTADATQTGGTRGATATFCGGQTYEITFTYSYQSWDSYNANGSIGNGAQFWDVLFVNVNSSQSVSSAPFGSPFGAADNLPAVSCGTQQSSSTFLPGTTWWVGGSQPNAFCPMVGSASITYTEPDPNKTVYVTVGLKTGVVHPSWGNVRIKVAVVPN